MYSSNSKKKIDQFEWKFRYIHIRMFGIKFVLSQWRGLNFIIFRSFLKMFFNIFFYVNFCITKNCYYKFGKKLVQKFLPNYVQNFVQKFVPKFVQKLVQKFIQKFLFIFQLNALHIWLLLIDFPKKKLQKFRLWNSLAAIAAVLLIESNNSLYDVIPRSLRRLLDTRENPH